MEVSNETSDKSTPSTSPILPEHTIQGGVGRIQACMHSMKCIVNMRNVQVFQAGTLHHLAQRKGVAKTCLLKLNCIA